MKSKTSVLIATSIEMSKIPMQVQYLELRPPLEVGISLLSYLTVKHLMNFLDSNQLAMSQMHPFLSTSHSVPHSRLWGQQRHWQSPFSPTSFAGHIWKPQASERQIHPLVQSQREQPHPCKRHRAGPQQVCFLFLGTAQQKGFTIWQEQVQILGLLLD